jgi:hypothetical protein
MEILLNVLVFGDSPVFRRYYLSSIVTSFDPRRGGGEDEGPGEFDLCREERRELREGVLYGVSVGVGREEAAAAAYSSSVSHAVIVLE